MEIEGPHGRGKIGMNRASTYFLILSCSGPAKTGTVSGGEPKAGLVRSEAVIPAPSRLTRPKAVELGVGPVESALESVVVGIGLGDRKRQWVSSG